MSLSFAMRQVAGVISGLRAWLLRPGFVPVVFAVGVIVRLLVATLIPVEPLSDYAWYVAKATDLARGLGYVEGGVPTAYWPIGWPAILAVGLMLTGSLPVALIGLNLAGAAATMLLIVWFGRRVVGSEVAARGALLGYALYPNHIAYVGVAGTEVVYTALLLCAFGLLIAKRRRIWWLLASGILFGLATLVKPQTIAFPLGGWIALALVYADVKWRQMLLGCVMVYATLLAVVLPWSARNLEVFGDFVLVSTNGGTALFLGANDEMQGGHYEYQETQAFHALGIPWSERVTRQVELDRKQKEAARRWISENPLTYIAWMPYKVALLWFKDTDGFWTYDNTYPDRVAIVRALQILNQLVYVAMLLLAIPCALVALRALYFRDYRECPLALLFCAPVFVSLLAAFFTGQIRYHFPAMPFVVLAVAWTVFHLRESVGSIRLRAARAE